MKLTPITRLALAAVLLGATVLFYFLGTPAPKHPEAERMPTNERSFASTPAPRSAIQLPAVSSGAPSTSDAPLLGDIEQLLQRLRSGEASDDDLQELRERLLSSNPEQAIAAIQQFLASGDDAATRQDFMIGEGGTLAGAPSLRTFLMDLLGRIAKKNGSPAAATLARQVLDTKTSPEEWAISLRNVAWSDPKAAPYLLGKMREMFGHEPWVAEPTPGMLEAFDVIVFARDASFIPDLANFLRGGNPMLQRASAVALDRLSESAPLEVMTYLNTHPAELAEKPFLRADYYAKADLSESAQRQAVETYLSRGDVSVEEKTKLLRGLATPASFVSENLLTQPIPPDDSPKRQDAYVQALNEWKSQSRFPELLGEITQVQGRLGR